MDTVMKRCPCCTNHCAEGEFRCGNGAVWFAQQAMAEETRRAAAQGKKPSANDLPAQIAYLAALQEKVPAERLYQWYTAEERKKLCELLGKAISFINR